MDWKDFQGVNLAHVQELYEQFQRDPNSVDPADRAVLEQLPRPSGIAGAEAAAPVPAIGGANVVGAMNLAQSIRRYGHLAAQIDPLGGERPGDPLLEAATHGLSGKDLREIPPTLIDSPVTAGASSMADVVSRLRDLYCSTT